MFVCQAVHMPGPSRDMTLYKEYFAQESLGASFGAAPSPVNIGPPTWCKSSYGVQVIVTDPDSYLVFIETQLHT